MKHRMQHARSALGIDRPWLGSSAPCVAILVPRWQELEPELTRTARVTHALTCAPRITTALTLGPIPAEIGHLAPTSVGRIARCRDRLVTPRQRETSTRVTVDPRRTHVTGRPDVRPDMCTGTRSMSQQPTRASERVTIDDLRASSDGGSLERAETSQHQFSYPALLAGSRQPITPIPRQVATPGRARGPVSRRGGGASTKVS